MLKCWSAPTGKGWKKHTCLLCVKNMSITSCLPYCPLMAFSNCQTDLNKHHPSHMSFLPTEVIPPNKREFLIQTRILQDCPERMEKKENNPQVLQKEDVKRDSKLSDVFSLPCLWTRALCLCNEDWSDLPAISTLGEDWFCSSLADPGDRLHNTEFLQVCYYATEKSQFPVQSKQIPSAYWTVPKGEISFPQRFPPHL